MIFSTDQPIDDIFLDLIKELKKLVKTNPTISWMPDHNSWLITLEDWISLPVSIYYHITDKQKFEIVQLDVDPEVDDKNNPLRRSPILLESVKDVKHYVYYLKLLDQNVSYPIIQFLAECTQQGLSIEEALEKIVLETKITIMPGEMEILKINKKHRGRVYGNIFGI